MDRVAPGKTNKKSSCLSGPPQRENVSRDTTQLLPLTDACCSSAKGQNCSGDGIHSIQTDLLKSLPEILYNVARQVVTIGLK